VKVGGHPMESVSHGLWKEKVGRSANLSLKILLFCMEDSKNPIASRWQRQPPLKTNFYLSVLQMKSSSTWRCPMHLCFAIPWRTSWKPLWYVFPYDLNTCLTFNVLLFMIFRLRFFSCYNMVAKFYCQNYVS
jgi:hypothetical protein